MRIVQLANLYSPVSGGLRTAVNALGRGYVAAGHERVLIVPGAVESRVETDTDGLVITVPGVPVGAGYRMITNTGQVLRLLDELAPNSVEVSDKLTLTRVGRWARRAGVRSVLLSHERLDAILAPRVPDWVPLERVADLWNRRLVGSFDAIVVTSAFAREEFERIGAPSLFQVPLGVDLETFRPRGDTGSHHETRLVYVGRLSAEKHPDLVLGAVRVLTRRGLAVRLDVLGDGPARERLERETSDLPVVFHGHVGDRAEVAEKIGAADIALAPCPVESFGLSVLEALACGTPVVAAARGAAPELLTPGAGLAVPPTDEGLADGVETVLTWPAEDRRRRARARAEEFPWSATVDRMLAVHAGAPVPAGVG
ncbi:glycosyl transferase [Carbonactinospora thermoautotrophica]|uniref:glycosyltransferase n=1 Tax=Carbonactinospora thermoautotrophica TaxID=1469144 RepID=UPI002270C99C|nr:glycosyltransferase [Carbonactinospora thermoautotrophica]MCX9190357.1 glycosyl transferase [Carbonactinospora thermoautotrophica]